MKTIYKYPLMIKDLQTVKMHSPGEILKVGSQNGQVCIWALADSDAPIIEREIAICGTGLPCPYPIEQHLGTVIIGVFVWHVFSTLSRPIFVNYHKQQDFLYVDFEVSSHSFSDEADLNFAIKRDSRTNRVVGLIVCEFGKKYKNNILPALPEGIKIDWDVDVIPKINL